MHWNNQIMANKLNYGQYLLIAKINYTVIFGDINAEISLIAEMLPLIGLSILHIDWG